jgi:hypothetical protein
VRIIGWVVQNILIRIADHTAVGRHSIEETLLVRRAILAAKYWCLDDDALIVVWLLHAFVQQEPLRKFRLHRLVRPRDDVAPLGMLVANRLRIQPPEPSPARTEGPAALSTLASVLRVVRALALVRTAPLLRVPGDPAHQPFGTREHGTAMLTTRVLWVLPADAQVLVALYIAKRGEQTELRYEYFATVATLKAVHWIHLARLRMSVPQTWIEELLPTETLVVPVLVATRLVSIALRLAIGAHQPQVVVGSDEDAVTVWAGESIGRVGFASHGVLLPCSWVREDLAAITHVLRIVLATQLVLVPLHPTIQRTVPEHIVGRQVTDWAILALEGVRGILRACDGVCVPGIWIWEELPAEAPVCWVVLAAPDMDFPHGLPVRAEEARNPVARHELLGAVWTLEAVGWVVLASDGMVVPGGGAGEDAAAETLVPWVLLTSKSMCVTNYFRILPEDAPGCAENSLAVWTSCRHTLAGSVGAAESEAEGERRHTSRAGHVPNGTRVARQTQSS